MKKLFGFTMAEILITLGIIGVIAALTIPTISTELKKKTYTSSLQVAISDFETAMKNMIERENVDSIKNTQAWTNGIGLTNQSADASIQAFVDGLSPYLQISSFNKADRSYKQLNSDTPVTVDGIKYKSKKGIEYIITWSNGAKINENNALANGVSYTEKAADVNIDVNGDTPPNKIGRDLFFYELGADGTLYPIGSKDYNFYTSNGNTTTADTFTNGCTGGDKSNCSEYLKQNGYKMDY